ncbi:ArnT family glycosyltransferase [Cobetia sp. L2A1]|uniref:ArnT family glycosyltransferase n=1 Tax=Cobetia sp. L2A1 TaxID=2686360 RepID=UPI00131A64B2|nr:hypothetical protein [Cobetia sp. L2A1]
MKRHDQAHDAGASPLSISRSSSRGSASHAGGVRPARGTWVGLGGFVENERLSWALWLVLLVAGVLARPYLPIDETRYVSVAWEMWHSNQWFVSTMNGAPYADKPVLLFWLIHAGWAVFGVNGWWPKLVMPLVSLLGIWQLGRVARTLWPAVPEQAEAFTHREQWVRLSRWTLAGCLMWMLYSQALMFDVLLTSCLLGALRPWCSPQGDMSVARRDVLESGLWLGLALLAKGPVALLWFVLVVGSRPWWAQAPVRQVLAIEWRGWLGSLLLGLGVLSLWLVPAVIDGPASYVQDLLWGQTANRVMEAQDHARPLWWYLPWLALLIFPFSLRPRLLVEGLASSIAQRPHQERPLLRMCRVWSLAGLAVFSLISGKQIHYLMPLLVPMSLLMAWAALRQPAARTSLRLLAMLCGALAASSLVLGVLVMPSLTLQPADSALAASTSGSLACVLAGGLLILLMLWLWPWQEAEAASPAIQLNAQRRLVLGSLLLVTCLLTLTLRPLWPRLDQGSLAQWVNARQQAGQQVAVVANDYQATYQFLGRLTQPLDTLSRAPRQLHAWQQEHPAGWLLMDVTKCLSLDDKVPAEEMPQQASLMGMDPRPDMQAWCQAHASGRPTIENHSSRDSTPIFHQGRHQLIAIPAQALIALPYDKEGV